MYDGGVKASGVEYESGRLVGTDWELGEYVDGTITGRLTGLL